MPMRCERDLQWNCEACFVVGLVVGGVSEEKKGKKTEERNKKKL